MRYFILFFMGEYNEASFRGWRGYESRGMINAQTACDMLKEDRGYDHVVVTNLIELEEEDYDDFVWKSEGS